MTSRMQIGKRAPHTGAHPPVRRGAGQVLRLGVRAGHHLQLREGVLHPGRARHGGRDPGDVEEGRPQADRVRRQLPGGGDHLAGAERCGAHLENEDMEDGSHFVI